LLQDTQKEDLRWGLLHKFTTSYERSSYTTNQCYWGAR